jgi:ligand-binding sensor domain-containing protein
MAKKITLWVGTHKGLFKFETTKARKRWQLSGPYLAGWEVSSVLPDNGSLLVGTTHYVYGATIRVSRDGGESQI